MTPAPVEMVTSVYLQLEVSCLGQSVPHLPSCVLVTVDIQGPHHQQSNPMQLTVQDRWDNPAAVADFHNLDNITDDRRRAAGLSQQ